MVVVCDEVNEVVVLAEEVGVVEELIEVVPVVVVLPEEVWVVLVLTDEVCVVVVTEVDSQLIDCKDGSTLTSSHPLLTVIVYSCSTRAASSMYLKIPTSSNVTE